MKTRCPSCQTTFRVTPDQLKARAGKVRCGQCQTVFNALDSLLDEASASVPGTTPGAAALPQAPAAPQAPAPTHFAATENRERSTDSRSYPLPEAPFIADEAPPEFAAELAADAASDPMFAEPPALTEAAAQELGKATGLIMPRETTDIPGYSKWAEGVMAGPISPAPEKTARGLFMLAALLLALTLVGQAVFRFRSEIAITAPSLRPALEVLCQALGAEIPLPRHVELVSIETSDLQSDPARGNLLVLNATLHNRANYGQAFPSLELSLTDTQDAAIARRVFAPIEYLSAKIPPGQPFAANSDVAVRLWIEAREIAAAGYRLYVFYP